MTNTKSKQVTNNNARAPLFTGNFKRDTAVSEAEKAAEISQVFFDWIVKNVVKHTK